MRTTISFTVGCFFILNLLVSSTAHAQVIASDDFLYNQPTKAFGAGGGFLQQTYAGGDNGPAGQWIGPWISTGDGVITGSDIMEEPDGYIVEEDRFQGATRNGLSENHLQRGFEINNIADSLYFGVTIRNRAEGPSVPLFTLNDPGGASQISMGFGAEGGITGILGETSDFIEGPELTDGLDPYKLMGRLELNANSDDERLTVWLDPTGVEEAEHTFSVEADVLASFDDLAGTLRLDHNSSSAVVYWDDVALATSWEAAASVDIPRATLLMDPETGETAIVNKTADDIDAIYYDISSERGRIRNGDWNTLEAQGVSGWVASPDTRNLLIESNFRESTVLAPGDQLRLGPIAPTSSNDLAGTLATTEGLLNILQVELGPVGSACDPNTQGDFDGNGKVEFADFLILSANFGRQVEDHTKGDEDCNGTVEFADFLVLSANFGNDVGGAQAVPEPSASNLLGIGLLLSLSRFRRRSSK